MVLNNYWILLKKSGIKRFLHISTEALLFMGEDLNNIDETYPYPKKSKFLYSESKLEAEKLVLAAHENNVFEIMVIRPRLVWGPGDHTVLPVLVNMVKQNKYLYCQIVASTLSSLRLLSCIKFVQKMSYLYVEKIVVFSENKSFFTI